MTTLNWGPELLADAVEARLTEMTKGVRRLGRSTDLFTLAEERALWDALDKLESASRCAKRALRRDGALPGDAEPASEGGEA